MLLRPGRGPGKAGRSGVDVSGGRHPSGSGQYTRNEGINATNLHHMPPPEAKRYRQGPETNNCVALQWLPLVPTRSGKRSTFLPILCFPAMASTPNSRRPRVSGSGAAVAVNVYVILT